MQFSGVEGKVVLMPLGITNTEFALINVIDVNREKLSATYGLCRTSMGGLCSCPENKGRLVHYFRINPNAEVEIGDAAIGLEFLRPVLRIWIRRRRDTGFRTLRIGPSEGNPGDGYLEQEMPAQLLAHCVIRTRRDGDRIRPFGSKGSRKLQDYLTDRGVDYPWRDRIPLLCNGTEVLLVGGVGAGGIPRGNPEADNVRLRWTGRMLWSE